MLDSLTSTGLDLAAQYPVLSLVAVALLFIALDQRFSLGGRQRARRKVTGVARANSRWLVLAVGGFVVGQLFGRVGGVDAVVSTVETSIPLLIGGVGVL